MYSAISTLDINEASVVLAATGSFKCINAFILPNKPTSMTPFSSASTSPKLVHLNEVPNAFNILKVAKKFGDVTVGLLTDQAIASYKNIPHLSYKEREVVLKNIRYVSNVIPQKTLDYTYNLNLLKPDFVVHGDDWKSGIQKKTREKVIKELKKWGGKLIEPKYTKKISSTLIKKKISEIVSTENRVSRLKRLLNSKNIVRILESHNSLTGLIIENLKIKKNKKSIEFDGMWSSSLTDSATKGKPDNSSVDFSSRISSLNEMMDVTSKPLVFDADNGGQLEH